MLDEFWIEQRGIGRKHKPFVVAELSANHRGSKERAFKLIEAAKKAGADAIKLQTYTEDTMTVDSNAPAFCHEKESLFASWSLYELYKEAKTPWEWHKELFSYANKLGLIAFSTPFDETSVAFLEKLEVPCYKIASLELTDLPLIQTVAKTKKPIFLSTGTATGQEITEALETIRQEGNQNIVLLKCVSAYPTPLEEVHLATLQDYATRFDVLTGLSDHTLTTLTAAMSVALGACVIEKHLTLSREEGGIDAPFSLEPQEFTTLCQEVNQAYLARGDVHYGPTLHEKDAYKHRRSLLVTQPIKKGELFTKENVKPLRPGIGLAPKHYEEILGQQANCDLKPGDPITWGVIL